jgi:hypothetical protein
MTISWLGLLAGAIAGAWHRHTLTARRRRWALELHRVAGHYDATGRTEHAAELRRLANLAHTAGRRSPSPRP